MYKIQYSEMCLCIDSESDSWYRSMNFHLPEIVKKLIKIALEKETDENKASKVIKSYRRSLLFDSWLLIFTKAIDFRKRTMFPRIGKLISRYT